MDEASKPPSAPIKGTTRTHASGSFQDVLPTNNLHVNVTADNLNIHQPSLGALERIAERSPDVASQLIAASRDAMRFSTVKHVVGAVCALLIALAIILASTFIIVKAGFWAGIAFFLICVVICALVTAIFTGKVQDISWTAKVLRPSSTDRSKDGVGDDA